MSNVIFNVNLNVNVNFNCQCQLSTSIVNANCQCQPSLLLLASNASTAECGTWFADDSGSYFYCHTGTISSIQGYEAQCQSVSYVSISFHTQTQIQKVLEYFFKDFSRILWELQSWEKEWLKIKISMKSPLASCSGQFHLCEINKIDPIYQFGSFLFPSPKIAQNKMSWRSFEMCLGILEELVWILQYFHNFSGILEEFFNKFQGGQNR